MWYFSLTRDFQQLISASQLRHILLPFKFRPATQILCAMNQLFWTWKSESPVTKLEDSSPCWRAVFVVIASQRRAFLLVVNEITISSAKKFGERLDQVTFLVLSSKSVVARLAKFSWPELQTKVTFLFEVSCSEKWWKWRVCVVLHRRLYPSGRRTRHHPSVRIE